MADPLTTSLVDLRDAWRSRWPAALQCWSRFIQLSEPRWCFSQADEKQEHLSGSFAMIRLVDHAVVISLAQVRAKGLDDFAAEILAHEIGHHAYCPADLTDNARMLSRMRIALPTKEQAAPMVANLYADLLINDRLQRDSSLNLAGVYRQLGAGASSRLWTLYMRIYELLWSLAPGSLAFGPLTAPARMSFDGRLNSDAQLGARLIRSYAREWLSGCGRFAALCLPYILDDAKENAMAVQGWEDLKEAGAGGFPDGLTSIDDDEVSRDPPRVRPQPNRRGT